MISRLCKKIYLYQWPDDSARWAEIQISFSNDLKHKIDCKFHCLRNPYDIDDWKFLGNLSKEILEIYEAER